MLQVDLIATVSYTYSIDLSQSWTTANVTPLAVSVFSQLTHVKNPVLWYDPAQHAVNMWGGLTFNASESPGFYSFVPDNGGGVSWVQSTVPSSNGHALDGLWGSACAASPDELYCVGGVDTYHGNITPVRSMVENNFAAASWTNETHTNGYDDKLTFDSRMEYVPNFGSKGVLVVLSGRVFQNQSSYNDNETTLAGFSTVDIYDVAAEKWYSQDTQGAIPPEVTDFCSVGMQAEDGASYEM